MAAWTVIVCIGVAVFFGLTDDLGDPYPVEESAPTETVQTEPVPEQPELPVSEAQAEHLLSPLYQAMKSDSMKSSAVFVVIMAVTFLISAVVLYFRSREGQHRSERKRAKE